MIRPTTVHLVQKLIGVCDMDDCCCYGCTTMRHPCVNDLKPSSSSSAALKLRPQLFRCFVTNQYHANRDEYDSMNQVQPWSFDTYVRRNLKALKAEFKLHKKINEGLTNK